MPGLGSAFTRLTRTLIPRAPLAPDGLPFPSEKLIHAVAGTSDRAWFWQGGQLGAQTIRDILARRQITISSRQRILDFGCGCGRVLRHLAPEAAPGALHGTDYNPALVRWCARTLRSATVARNRLTPPTAYPDATFDFIYAFSVFTHLTEPLQHGWLAELRRISRPGGLILITTHGDRYQAQMGEADRARYSRGELVVWSGESEGKNRCAAFHPPSFVREQLAPRAGLTVGEFAAEGALGNPHQDAWLLARSE